VGNKVHAVDVLNVTASKELRDAGTSRSMQPQPQLPITAAAVGL
jgi:hypothetical protein